MTIATAQCESILHIFLLNTKIRVQIRVQA